MVTVRMPIEVDITQVNKTWFSLRKPVNVKHYVIGFCQREGDAIIEYIEDNDVETIVSSVLKHTQTGSILYAEEGILPEQLCTLYEIHELNGNRVKGDIHVNHVKNLWKDLKRVIKQTHISVSKKHLQLYCDEVAWRFNHRNLSAFEKFNLLLSNAAKGAGVKRTQKDIVK